MGFFNFVTNISTAINAVVSTIAAIVLFIPLLIKDVIFPPKKTTKTIIDPWTSCAASPVNRYMYEHECLYELEPNLDVCKTESDGSPVLKMEEVWVGKYEYVYVNSDGSGVTTDAFLAKKDASGYPLISISEYTGELVKRRLVSGDDPVMTITRLWMHVPKLDKDGKIIYKLDSNGNKIKKLNSDGNPVMGFFDEFDHPGFEFQPGYKYKKITKEMEVPDYSFTYDSQGRLANLRLDDNDNPVVNKEPDSDVDATVLRVVTYYEMKPCDVDCELADWTIPSLAEGTDEWDGRYELSQQSIPILDTDGNPVLNEFGNPTFSIGLQPDNSISGWGQCIKEDVLNEDGSVKYAAGTQNRSRLVKTAPHRGGATCPDTEEHRNCDVACEMTEWTPPGHLDEGYNKEDCNKDTGYITRTRSIKYNPMYDGKSCIDDNGEWDPACDMKLACDDISGTPADGDGITGSGSYPTGTFLYNSPCPVDCEVSTDWINDDGAECSEICGPGTIDQHKDILVTPKNGGAACPTGADMVGPQTCEILPCRDMGAQPFYLWTPWGNGDAGSFLRLGSTNSVTYIEVGPTPTHPVTWDESTGILNFVNVEDNSIVKHIGGLQQPGLTGKYLYYKADSSGLPLQYDAASGLFKINGVDKYLTAYNRLVEYDDTNQNMIDSLNYKQKPNLRFQDLVNNGNDISQIWFAYNFTKDPVDGTWSDWVASGSCDNETSDPYEQSRSCDGQAYGGAYCVADDDGLLLTKTEACPLCAIDHDDWVVSEPCKFDPQTGTYKDWLIRGTNTDLSSCAVQGKWSDTECAPMLGEYSDWNSTMPQTNITGGGAAVDKIVLYGDYQVKATINGVTSRLTLNKLELYNEVNDVVWSAPAGNWSSIGINFPRVVKTFDIGSFPMTTKVEFNGTGGNGYMEIWSGASKIKTVNFGMSGIAIALFPLVNTTTVVDATICDPNQSGDISWDRTCDGAQYVAGTLYSDADEVAGLGSSGQPRDPATYCAPDVDGLMKTTDCAPCNINDGVWVDESCKLNDDGKYYNRKVRNDPNCDVNMRWGDECAPIDQKGTYSAWTTCGTDGLRSRTFNQTVAAQFGGSMISIDGVAIYDGHVFVESCPFHCTWHQSTPGDCVPYAGKWYQRQIIDDAAAGPGAIPCTQDQTDECLPQHSEITYDAYGDCNPATGQQTRSFTETAPLYGGVNVSDPSHPMHDGHIISQDCLSHQSGTWSANDPIICDNTGKQTQTYTEEYPAWHGGTEEAPGGTGTTRTNLCDFECEYVPNLTADCVYNNEVGQWVNDYDVINEGKNGGDMCVVDGVQTYSSGGVIRDGLGICPPVYGEYSAWKGSNVAVSYTMYPTATVAIALVEFYDSNGIKIPTTGMSSITRGTSGFNGSNVLDGNKTATYYYKDRAPYELDVNFGTLRDIASIVIYPLTNTTSLTALQTFDHNITLSDDSVVNVDTSNAVLDAGNKRITIYIPGGTTSSSCDTKTSNSIMSTRTCTGSQYIPGSSLALDTSVCAPDDPARILEDGETDFIDYESCPPCDPNDPTATWTTDGVCVEFNPGDYRVRESRTDLVDPTVCDPSVLYNWGPAGVCEAPCDIPLDSYLGIALPWEYCSTFTATTCTSYSRTATIMFDYDTNKYMVASTYPMHNFYGPRELICGGSTATASWADKNDGDLEFGMRDGMLYLKYITSSGDIVFDQIVDPANVPP
jgi:hypothetical protein